MDRTDRDPSAVCTHVLRISDPWNVVPRTSAPHEKPTESIPWAWKDPTMNPQRATKPLGDRTPRPLTRQRSDAETYYLPTN